MTSPLRAQLCPSPRRSPRARRPSAPTPPSPPAPSWRVGAARSVASSAPALAARRVSAPLALPRHHRDITLRAQRCPSPRRRPSARRPSAPTPPSPPAPSWRVGAAHLVASSAPARAARRVSAPLALPRHHRDLTMRALRCPSPRHRPSARRPSAPTSPLPSAPSWRVDVARPVASSAPARAARRVSAPLALPRHHRDITFACSAVPIPAPQPESASTFCADAAVVARAFVARRRCSPCCELGAGPCRAPSERTSRAPSSPP